MSISFTSPLILVTGGAGFLGGAIAGQLLARGVRVRAFQRSAAPELAARGVEIVQGDLTRADDVRRAVEGAGAVIHTAAKAGMWGDEAIYRAVNVEGTRHVIDACRATGCRKLVFTSSPSVVHAGGDQEGVDEGEPYPVRHQSHYSATKAEAERLVMAAHGDELHTASIRPHLIWGPGDPHLLPRLMDRARRGRLMRVGDGRNRVDVTYIDNAAYAHLLALDALMDNPGRVGGKTYFISQGEPVALWPFIDRLLAAGGLPPPRRSISHGAARRIGAFCEGVYKILGFKKEPPMTRFAADQLATSHWYDLTAARRDLSYRPLVSVDEGLARLEVWLNRST